jgi:hypothetical protein
VAVATLAAVLRNGCLEEVGDVVVGLDSLLGETWALALRSRMRQRSQIEKKEANLP